MYLILVIYILTEDIDPSVGRFRNMVQTAVIPIKVRLGFVILKMSDSVERLKSVTV